MAPSTVVPGTENHPSREAEMSVKRSVQACFTYWSGSTQVVRKEAFQGYKGRESQVFGKMR